MEETTFDGGDSWDVALQQQNDERERAMQQKRAELMSGIVNDNRAVFDNYGQIMQKDAMERAQRARNGAVNLLAAYKYSLMNHNMMPQQMVPGVNDALGFDMNTRAMYSAGVMPNFNMVLGIASKDPQTGQMSNEEKEVSAADIYNISRENPGILNRDEMMSLRENIIRRNHWTMDMANKYLPELPQGWGEVAVGERSPSGGIRVPGSWMGTPERRGGAVFSSDGRGGWSNTRIGADGGVTREDGGTRSPDYKGRWRVLSSGSHGGQRGTRYENDRTGEVIFVPEGQTISGVQSGTSEKERIAKINASGKIAAEEMKDRRERDIADARNQTQIAAAELRSGNSSKPSARFDGKAYSALNDYLTELTTDADGNKRELSPEDQKKADRIRAKMDEMLGVGGTDESQDIAQAGATPSDLARQALARRMAAKKAQAQDGGQQQQEQAAGGTQDATQMAQDGGAQGGGVNWTPGHDLRNDGKTYKGTGWLGVLRLPNGGVASEYTVGVEIGGKEIDIPTLVPTLTKEEQDLMVNDIIPNNKDIPDSIMKKAVDFAKMRLANGRSVFANDGTPQGSQQGQKVANPNAKPVVNRSASEIAAGRNRQAASSSPDSSGDMTAAQIVQKRNAGKPQEPVGENEQRLRDEENDRIRRMIEMGGEVTDERGGKRRVKIANWDYLSDDEKRLWPEYSSKLTEDVVMAQRLANEAKERWEAQWGENSEWYKGEVDEIRKQAEKRHPDNAGQRQRYIEKKIKRLKAISRGENPTSKRENEDRSRISGINFPF